MTFGDPVFLALAALVVVLWLGKRPRSTIGHPSVITHANIRSVPLIGRLPMFFISLCWISLSVALARPMLINSHEVRTIQTRDFILTVDVSSSMDGTLPEGSSRIEPVCESERAQNEDSGATARRARIDAAREAALAFVECRQGDRIGLIYFGDLAYPVSPLTSDLSISLRMLTRLGDYSAGGTNFDGPTDSDGKIGGIQAAINLFKDMGEAESKVLIFITDGEDSMTAARVRELKEQMRELGIRIYVLGIGDQWTGSSTQALRAFVEDLGGQVIAAGDAGELRAAFARINELETSPIQIEQQVEYQDIYPIFVSASLLFAALYLAAASVLRQDA